jgi:acetolactate decarboxylase
VKASSFRMIFAASRRSRLLLAAILSGLGAVVLWLMPQICAAQDTREIYQVSSREAMAVGRFDDGPTIETLKKHGDFGLGTFDGFDGELILVNGKAYQARVDGPPKIADDSARSPFALVTFFKPSQTMVVHEKTDLAGLEQLIVGAMPSRKIYCAIRVTANFKSIKSRSVPVQHRPYPTLIQALEQEHVLNLSDTEATMVGFWSPPVMAEMSGGGLHLHFISADGDYGGHVLNCEFAQAKVEIEPIRHIEITLVDH